MQILTMITASSYIDITFDVTPTELLLHSNTTPFHLVARHVAVTDPMSLSKYQVMTLNYEKLKAASDFLEDHRVDMSDPPGWTYEEMQVLVWLYDQQRKYWTSWLDRKRGEANYATLVACY